jgi:hypothetical protein
MASTAAVGWVAGVWFMIFPVTDWASYALAMATLGCGLVICWLWRCAWSIAAARSSSW